jgi:hypothetical protein
MKNNNPEPESYQTKWPGWNSFEEYQKTIVKQNRYISDLETRQIDMLNALKLTIPIIGKVIADNLMPDIVSPSYPQKTLDKINAAIAKAQEK